MNASTDTNIFGTEVDVVFNGSVSQCCLHKTKAYRCYTDIMLTDQQVQWSATVYK